MAYDEDSFYDEIEILYDDDEELKPNGCKKLEIHDDYEEETTRMGGPKYIFKSKDLYTNKSLKKATRLAMDDLKSKYGDYYVLKRLISGKFSMLAGDYFDLDLELEDELGKSYLYQVNLYRPLSSVHVEITGKLIPEFVEPNVDELMVRVSHNLVKPADTKKNCLLSLFKKKSSRAGQFPRTIVHAEKKTECSEVAKALVAQNLRVVACCGERESEAVNEFRRGLADILVVHGSASRGLDVDPFAGHVVNLNLPKTMKDYLSRIGWTACGGRVTSFYTDRDMALVAEIKKAIVGAESGKGKVKEIPAQGDTEAKSGLS
ncbi:RNA helicase [Ranunculus cassubicifolius]